MSSRKHDSFLNFHFFRIPIPPQVLHPLLLFLNSDLWTSNVFHLLHLIKYLLTNVTFSSFFCFTSLTSFALFLVSSIFFQVFISSCFNNAILLASSYASFSALEKCFNLVYTIVLLFWLLQAFCLYELNYTHPLVVPHPMSVSWCPWCSQRLNYEVQSHHDLYQEVSIHFTLRIIII